MDLPAESKISWLGGAVLVVTTCLLWLRSTLPGPSLASVLDPLPLVLFLVLLGGHLLVSFLGWVRVKSWKRRAAALILLISLGWLGLWTQRYTDLGVFLLGGASHWIGRAAEADDAEARRYLALVLSSTQYGVDQAERSVLELPSAEQRERLFRLLSDMAPNPAWRERYRHQADEAEHLPELYEPEMEPSETSNRISSRALRTARS